MFTPPHNWGMPRKIISRSLEAAVKMDPVCGAADKNTKQ